MSNKPESPEESQIKVLVLGRSESGKESVVKAMKGQFDPEDSSKVCELTRGTVCLEEKSIKVLILNATCVCDDYSENEIKKSINDIKEKIIKCLPGPHVIIWVSNNENKENDKLLSALPPAFYDEKLKGASRHVLFVPIGHNIPEKGSLMEQREKILTFTESAEWGKTLLERVVKMKNNNNSEPCNMDFLLKQLDEFSKKLVKNYNKSKNSERGHAFIDGVKDCLFGGKCEIF